MTPQLPTAAPLISVVIPGYRHARFVREALLSALAQEMPLEILFCDDASPDATFAAAHTVDDPRIRRWRHDANRGADVTLNELILRASGRYIAILNSDDRFHPERLRRCLEVLTQGEADLVGTDIRLIGPEGQPITEHWWLDAYEALKNVWRTERDWLAALWAGNLFMTSSNFVMTRALWEAIGGFRAYRYVLDYDFLLRALIHGARLKWIDTPLLDYRLHDCNTIFEKPLAANQEAAALLRNTLPGLLARFGHRIPQIAHLTKQLARFEELEIAILRAEQHDVLTHWQQTYRALHALQAAFDQQRAAGEALRQHAIHLLAQREEALAELDHPRTAPPPAKHSLLSRTRQIVRRVVHSWHNTRDLARALPQTPLRVKGFAPLRRWLRRHPEIRTLSFDVFDTLVLRLIEPPERIHLRLAEALAQRLATSSRRVLKAREAVEQTLRSEAVADGHDHECHWEALIPRWIERLTPFHTAEERAELIAFATQEELRLERLALRPKRNARLFLRWAKRNGYRLIAISDMYLGERQLKALLDALGFDDLFDHIFVSSEARTAKYSGRLFTHVLERLDLAPQTVLHIGDNLHSDAIAPSRLGIPACFLDEPAEQRRRRMHHRAAHLAARFRGIWPGREMAQLLLDAYRFDATTRTPDPYFQYGLTVLGPIFATFMVGLIEAVRRDRPEHLYFLARDGHLFYTLYQTARARFPELPLASYLYASRRTVAAAAVADGLTSEQAAFALLHPKQKGLQTICKTFALPIDALEPLATRHQLTPFDAPLQATDARLAAFLADSEVQYRITQHGKSARKRLYAYFAQNGFFAHPKVALVDIGWNATIQRFLERAFAAEVPHYPKVFGYYFALANAIHSDPIVHGSATGLFSDLGRCSPWERAPFDFEELFEQAARALHATTVGYEEKPDGQIAPVLKPETATDRQAECAANPLIAQLQAGVSACWRHFLPLWELTGHTFADLKPYALALCERAVAYPAAEEVALIARLAHTEDLGDDHLLELVGTPLHWRQLLRPRRLARALAHTTWPYAPLASLPVFPKIVARWAHLRAAYRRSN
ncbi:MAG: HAD-IA family hydrolase [Hydrogenophilus thermoluteolus]